MLSRVARLEDLDDGILDGFLSGDAWMDDWLENKSRRQIDHGLCSVHVGIDDNGEAVGFFTLSTCQIIPADVSRRERHGFNNTAFGALLIGELAVRSDLRHCGLGYGTKLLHHAIRLACDISRDAGVSFVVVDPLGGDDDLCRWYQHIGFKAASGGGFRHYLSIRAAREMVEKLGKEYFVF